MVVHLIPRTQSGLTTWLVQQQSRFNLCPRRKALNKTIFRFLLSMAILLMSGVDYPLESSRTMAHLRGQRGPPGSVGPQPTTKLLYREESITWRQLLTLLSSNSSTISRFSLSMAIKRADRPNGSQQLMLRTPEVISGLANILKGKKDLYVIF